MLKNRVIRCLLAMPANPIASASITMHAIGRLDGVEDGNSSLDREASFGPADYIGQSVALAADLMQMHRAIQSAFV